MEVAAEIAATFPGVTSTGAAMLGFVCEPFEVPGHAAHPDPSVEHTIMLTGLIPEKSKTIQQRKLIA